MKLNRKALRKLILKEIRLITESSMGVEQRETLGNHPTYTLHYLTKKTDFPFPDVKDAKEGDIILVVDGLNPPAFDTNIKSYMENDLNYNFSGRSSMNIEENMTYYYFTK